MDPGEIEFIAEPAPTSGVPEPAPTRRLGPWAQAVIVLAVVVAAAVTVAHGSGSSKKPTAHQTVLPTGRLLGDGPSTTPATLGSSPEEEFSVPAVVLPPGCFSGACAISNDVPRGLASALREFVPLAARPAVLTFETTTSAGDLQAIQQRTIESVFGSVDLIVRIRAYKHATSASPSAIKETPPGLASAFLHVESASFDVDLEWIGPETQPPPMDALNKLIRDSRLEDGT